jgi:hypothetical protein
MWYKTKCNSVAMTRVHTLLWIQVWGTQTSSQSQTGNQSSTVACQSEAKMVSKYRPGWRITSPRFKIQGLLYIQIQTIFQEIFDNFILLPDEGIVAFTLWTNSISWESCQVYYSQLEFPVVSGQHTISKYRSLVHMSSYIDTFFMWNQISACFIFT